jgi:hypothetical protein
MRPIRLLTGLVSMALLVVGLVALLPDCASACTCAMIPGSQQQRAERALDQSTAVFAGEVVDISEGEPLTVSFRVSQVWKGPKRETLKLTTSTQEADSCAYQFSEGRKYLVYAVGRRMSVNICGETTPLSKASAHLEALGNGEAPESGGRALVDTSGGFLGLWIIAMMGLAMTAVSLVILLRLLRTS